MKVRLLVFIACAYLQSALGQGSNWVRQSPPSIVSDLYDLSVFDNQTSIAVGSNGSVLKTTDGGISWNSLLSGRSATFYAVDFVDRNMGWVAGSDGSIRKTTDGGVTWSTQSTGVGSYVSISSISFVNTQTGWLVATDNKIRKTTDGGATWAVQYTVTGTYVSLEDVYFRDANVGLVVGYAMGNGEVFRTTDGGQTWTSLEMGGSWMSRLHFVDNLTGWAVGITATSISYTSDPFGGGGLSISGQRAAVWKTTDGGVSWTTSSFTFSNRLYGVWFSDASNVVAAGTSGAILRTSDGGRPG